MNEKRRAKMEILSAKELQMVAGGIGPAAPPEVRAQDLYGNTLSIEEYMDHQINVANGQAHPHDFYSSGFNPGMPNIWRDPRP